MSNRADISSVQVAGATIILTSRMVYSPDPVMDCVMIFEIMLLYSHHYYNSYDCDTVG